MDWRLTIFCFLLPALLIAQTPKLIIPIGHSSAISSIDFSSDGKYVLTGSYDGTAKLWDRKGRELQTYTGNPSGVTTVVFSPDSKKLLIGSFNGAIEEFNLEGIKINEFYPGSYAGSQAAYSPDGQSKIVSNSETYILGGKDAYSGFFPKEEKDRINDPTAFVFAPNGRQVLTNFTNYFDNSNSAVLWTLDGDRIQTFKGHSDQVTAVDFSPDGKFILTGSRDSTAILWGLDGKIIRTFSGHNGDIVSVAYSPNGQHVLTASDNGTIKLWDLEGSELLSLKDYLGAGNQTIRFSPEGTHFLYASNQKAIYRNLKGELIQSFQGYAFLHTVIGCSNDQQILLQGEDNSIRLFDLKGYRKNYSIKPSTKNRHSLVVVPDRQRALVNTGEGLGVLDFSTGEITFFDPKYGAYKNQKFSWDGNSVISEDEEGGFRLWSLPAKESFQLNKKKENIVDTQFSPGGRFIIGKDNLNRFKLWDQQGKEHLRFLDDHDSITYLNLSPNDSLLITQMKNGNIGVWNILDQRLILEKTNTDSLKSASISKSNQYLLLFTHYGELELVNLLSPEPVFEWFAQTYVDSRRGEDSYARFAPEDKSILYYFGNKIYEASLDKTPLSLVETPDSYLIQDLTFSHDGQYYITYSVGGIGGQTLNLFSRKGDLITNFEVSAYERLRWDFIPGSSAFICSTDSELKFWALNSGEPLVNLVFINDNDWIASTNSGLFDASPASFNQMHYVVFYDGAYEVVELEQLKARYYEPGLLQKVLNLSDESLRPVQQFKDLLLFPKVNAIIQDDTLRVDLKGRNGGIGRLSIFINGKEVKGDANPLPRGEKAKRDSTINYNLLQHSNYLFRHPDSTNIVSLRAYNEEGWLKSQSIELEYKIKRPLSKGSTGQGSDAAWIGELDPKLYVVAVGTSDYRGTQLDLQYADQDASMMAKALASVGRALFTNGDSLEVHCLTTTTTDSTILAGNNIAWKLADRENIESVFMQIKTKAKAEDVIVVYLSGHGVTQSGNDQTQFYYLTKNVASEADLDDPATLRAYTISSEVLTRWINDIPALKQVLMIDACNSGQIVENLTGSTKTMNSSQVRALDRMKDRTGMFVLSGSASNKVSYEASEYGQGLLTYALLQGMLGLATRKDARGKEIIDVMNLFQYARDAVPRLAESVNGIQTPMLGFPSRGASFDIGILDDNSKEKIVLSNKKPVMIKSIFLNKKTFLDDLKLAELLEGSLRQESEKGSDADLIYVDVYDYPGAYSVSGLYEVKDGEIILELKLFKDHKNPIDLQISAESEPGLLIKRIKRTIEKEVSKH